VKVRNVILNQVWPIPALYTCGKDVNIFHL